MSETDVYSHMANIAKAELKEISDSRTSMKMEALAVDTETLMNIDMKYIKVIRISLKATEIYKTETSSNIDQVLQTLRNSTDALSEEVFADPYSFKEIRDERLSLAIINLNMGLVYINSDERKELLESEKHLTLSLDFLSENKMEAKAILITLTALDALNVIWQKLDPKISYETLDRALGIYMDYTKGGTTYPEPIDVRTIFCDESNEISEDSPLLYNLDKLQSRIIDNLIEISRNEFYNMHKFVNYMHNVLKQGMSQKRKLSCLKNYEWITTSLHLSNYFVHNSRFTEARHHVATASYMLQNFKQDEDDRAEKFRNCSHLNIIRSWASYGIKLLYVSSQKLRNDLLTGNVGKEKTGTKSKEQTGNLLIFPSMKKYLERIIATIMDKYMSNLTEAKSLFNNLETWFRELEVHYEKDGNLCQQATIALSMSNAYKYLTIFEHKRETIVTITKKRADLLDDMFNKLDKDSESTIEAYQRICLQLGIINTTRIDMIDEEIKIQNRKAVEEEINQMREIANNSMNYYLKYLTSVS